MKRKSGSRKSGRNEDAENGVDDARENGDNEEPQEKKSKKSKGRKSKSKNDSVDSDVESVDQQSTEEADPLADNDAEYEVEAILDDKTVKGVRHFLIRWKGYTEESDTWEPEHTLECSDLIKEYQNKGKDKKKDKKKKDKSKKTGDSEKWDENEDFEVDRILDVYFHKDGKRDFLVSWKGYPASQNTWEPEDNMDCKDLIKKFMQKVEEARKYENRELRTTRRPVQRLEFTMHESSRKMSRRYRGKERVHYYDAE